MGLVQNDLDKRILAEFARQNALYRATDADVVSLMAQIWVESGGDSGGLDDEYVAKIKTEIDNLKGAA